MNNRYFCDMYQKYHRFSMNCARKIVKEEMLAEDISQEVFYHLYEIIDKLDFSNERMLKSLIFMTSVNKAKDYIRKQKRKYKYSVYDMRKSVDIQDHRKNPEYLMLRKEETEYKKHILEKLRHVNPMNHHILLKVVYFGISPDFVAEEYGITRNNVNNRILRTRKWMKKELEKIKDKAAE